MYYTQYTQHITINNTCIEYRQTNKLPVSVMPESNAFRDETAERTQKSRSTIVSMEKSISWIANRFVLYSYITHKENSMLSLSSHKQLC